MCNFLSGVVTIERYPKVLCADLLHHEKTVQVFGRKPETYREWEWTGDGPENLVVRAAPGEDPNVLKSAILADYPTFVDCLNECIRQVVAHGGYLDLGSLTAIPEGLKLPKSIGGSLYLGSLTAIPEGLKLPESIGGYLYLGSLTAIPEGLKLPESIKSRVILKQCRLRRT